MIVTRHFPGALPPPYGPPWLAVVTCWPDNSSPGLRFGKRLEMPAGHVPACSIDASPGMVVKWGQKDHNTGATGNLGWGIVTGTGDILPVTETEARAQQWKISPADRTAPPTPGKGRGRGSRYNRATLAQTPPASSSSSPWTILDMDALAGLMLDARAIPNNDATRRSLEAAIVAWSEAWAADHTTTPASTPPEAPTPEPLPQEPGPPRAVPVTATDSQGYPLF